MSDDLRLLHVHGHTSRPPKALPQVRQQKYHVDADSRRNPRSVRRNPGDVDADDENRAWRNIRRVGDAAGSPVRSGPTENARQGGCTVTSGIGDRVVVVVDQDGESGRVGTIVRARGRWVQVVFDDGDMRVLHRENVRVVACNT